MRHLHTTFTFTFDLPLRGTRHQWNLKYLGLKLEYVINVKLNDTEDRNFFIAAFNFT